MAADGTSRKLCHWAYNTRYQDLPADVLKETLTLLYDQAGCMIASATLPSCQPVVDLVRKLGGPGDCSIVGHPVRTTVTYAALANGTIGHGNECNATGRGGTGQFSAVVVPAAFSVGQYLGSSGQEFCRAIVLGSEVGGRLVNLLGKYRKRGQFAASVGLAMGAATCAGTLLCLDAEQLENALALAAAGACGLNSYHQDDTHQAKSYTHGRAAEAGTIAALLAREGMHGPRDPLGTKNGFFEAFLDLPEAGEEFLQGLGENYAMSEIAYKRYPVGGPVQTPLYALLQTIREHKLAADDIEAIEVSLSRVGHNTVTTNHNPAVSIETVLSLAAVHGELTFPHVHDDRYLQEPRFKAFRERVKFSLTARPDSNAPGDRLKMGLTVRTRSGQALATELRFPLMTDDEVNSKYHALAGLRLSAGQAAALQKKLLGIESEKDVAPVIRELEIQYS